MSIARMLRRFSSAVATSRKAAARQKRHADCKERPSRGERKIATSPPGGLAERPLQTRAPLRAGLRIRGLTVQLQ
jgi:hypothetical protein